MAVFAWVAQQERERVRERVKAGLEKAKKKGAILGRPKADADVSKFEELKKTGLSYGAIALITKCSPSTVFRRLNEFS